MKNIHLTIYTALMTIAAIFVSGCSNEYDDVTPGNYVETERIETFPGDTVSVAGTASNVLLYLLFHSFAKHGA